MTLTPREIEDRLEAAALTLRRLPDPSGSGPKGYGSSWPDYVRDARHAYGYHEARMRIVPSAQEIAQMEEAIGWLARLSCPDDRHILWMRADGYRWKAICWRLGMARATAWRRWSAGILTISKSMEYNDKTRSRKGKV
jgi:hypothetical protein